MKTSESAPVMVARKRRSRPRAAAPHENGSRRGGRIPRYRKPADLSLEVWQIALRRQFGLEQTYRVRNIGDRPVFSEFEVSNPATGRTYRVAIRGQALGDNFCSCPDFAVNTLGTCKHVESVIGRMRKKRETRKVLDAGFQPDYSEIYLHYGPQRAVKLKLGAACPEALAARTRRYFDAAGVLRAGAFGSIQDLLTEAARGRHELRCYDDALAFIAQVRDRATLARRVDRMFPDGPASPAFDGLLKARLYPYQTEGAFFAARAGRCLIADDMGLGKTVQAIAAAEILARLGCVERVLIACPTSLKHQWQREIERFADRPSAIVEGLLSERQRRYAADSFFKITNYDVIHRDLEEIRRWRPDLVILDEAQRIKNWRTRTARSVKQLESDYAFVLTGTPLENRLEELYSIVEFVDRYRLGPMFRFLAEHQHVDENGRVVGYRNLSSVSTTLRPILIRRHKATVLKDLPGRLEKRFFVAMTDEQMRHHEENREMVARIVARWRRQGFLSESDQRRLQIALQNMRMSCNSTYLLDRTTDHGVKVEELAQLLDEILEEPETKVVIFSQWLGTHELIVRRAERRKWSHVFFHGGVPGRARSRLVARFREDPSCRLFLSTDAGGVGLNLQNASVVINMDQPWNPAVLEQRIGRLHRLGQQRPVRVIHFIAQGTIEEGMLGLLAFKQSMFAGVLDGGRDEVFLGKTRLTQFMESVEQATGAIPARMPSGDGAIGDAATGDGATGDGATDAASAARPDEAGDETAAAAQGAWGEVLTAGAMLLDKLGQALQAVPVRPGGRTGAPAAGLVARDEKTGVTYLRLPMPEPETLQKIVDLLSGLAKRR